MIVCDVCGISATYVVRDFREIKPQLHDEKLWAMWEIVEGSERHGCEDHSPRPGQLFSHDRGFLYKVQRTIEFHAAWRDLRP